MCLIIMFHGVYYIFNSLDNKVQLWRFTENNKIIGDMGFLAVDIFFLSSRCLGTYMYLKPLGCKEKLIKLRDRVLKRFFRLTPAYMTVLGIAQLSSTWFDKTSIVYMYERSHETCAKYWWRNLLYIHNFFGWDAMVRTRLITINLKLYLKTHKTFIKFLLHYSA
ncbi:nose resistant to fluoxetine protein 6-like [Temnothorax curvispinosus]|uniref:Nose resistant to fluoxetine protein 6-like n=1 Tax=Temnothorax curvispinosus TaxID=300111 RepID=A0A6J1PIF6_9HYME|nr:nose resistant to fluoxetine protein 6-like [Temnothorax curvispinosus]